MPWHWRPLLGPVWVEEAGKRESSARGKPCGYEKASGEVAETEIQNTGPAEKDLVAEETTVAEKPAVPGKLAGAEKPTIAETPGAQDKPTDSGGAATGLEVAILKNFEKVSPGVFRFKTGGGGALTDEKGMNDLTRKLKEMAISASGALPSSIESYKKVSSTSNGVPVYTFK